MNWETFYKFPITYRKWLLERINKEINKAAERQDGMTSKGVHNNTPDIRELTNKQRSTVPAKLQRFT